MIRVLIADDSTLARTVLADIFSSTRDIVVAAEAEDGADAVAKAAELRPDLIIMDIRMPVMDGLQAIEEIMAHSPAPILVLAATPDESDVNLAFQAIKRGALDVMEKPSGTSGLREAEQAIVEKVRMLARIRVIRHPRRQTAPPPRREIAPAAGAARRSILAIGASTGGPKAVMRIVKSLPADFAGTVFIVQHIAAGFSHGFAHWLDRECSIAVRLAADGDEYRAGEALVAPDGCHMVLEQGRVKLVDSLPVNCCKPSIDVFFRSVAAEGAERSVAVLLTGMGRDGAQGLRAIRDRGGLTIAQDEESCVVFGMPKAAIALEAADQVLPLAKIPDAVTSVFS